MFDAEGLKVLCGNSIEEPEVDYDDSVVESEIGYPVQEEAIREYYFVTVVDCMNTPEFRSQYNVVIPHIRKMSTEQQQLLAFAIVQKLPEKYDFQFSLNIIPYNQDEINELYEFLEFVEFKHEKFITDIWKYLKPRESNWFQIQKFCEHNIPKIMKEIEEQLDAHYFNELIVDFLRTYDKDKLVKWFCEKSELLDTAIILTLRKEQSNVR